MAFLDSRDKQRLFQADLRLFLATHSCDEHHKLSSDGPLCRQGRYDQSADSGRDLQAGSSARSSTPVGATIASLHFPPRRASYRRQSIHAPPPPRRTTGVAVQILAPEHVGHDFQGTSSTTLSYSAIPSTGSWNALTNPYAANGTSVLLGIGADLQLRDDLQITTDYGYLMQPHSRDQMIRLGLRKSF